MSKVDTVKAWILAAPYVVILVLAVVLILGNLNNDLKYYLDEQQSKIDSLKKEIQHSDSLMKYWHRRATVYHDSVQIYKTRIFLYKDKLTEIRSKYEKKIETVASFDALDTYRVFTEYTDW